MQNFWQAPCYPNASSSKLDPQSTPAAIARYGCGWFNETNPMSSTCCLFNVTADPSEYNDLREEQPSLYASLISELNKQRKTVYQTDWIEPNTTECMTRAQAAV